MTVTTDDNFKRNKDSLDLTIKLNFKSKQVSKKVIMLDQTFMKNCSMACIKCPCVIHNNTAWIKKKVSLVLVTVLPGGSHLYSHLVETKIRVPLKICRHVHRTCTIQIWINKMNEYAVEFKSMKAHKTYMYTWWKNYKKCFLIFVFTLSDVN